MKHSDSLQSALDHAENHAAALGARMTPLRRGVLSLLVEAGGPVKAYDLLDQINSGDGTAKPPTVYRTLDFLMEMGLAHKVEGLNAYIACAHCHHNSGAELFICRKCKNVEERAAEPKPVDTPPGFVSERSVVEHYGLCGKCA